MIKKLMIDSGLGGFNSCAYLDGGEQRPHAHQIGTALARELTHRGFEVLLASEREELLGQNGGDGRPARCAALAKRWGADCLLRICVGAARLPNEGSARGIVGGRGRSLALSESVLSALERQGDLRAEGTRCTSRYLLLRRASCPAMILFLGLPFALQERQEAWGAEKYARLIANGVERWAQ